MYRRVAPLFVLFVVALAGCASSPGTVPSGSSTPSTAVASSATGTATQAGSTPTSTGEAPTSAPVTGGTATDFCGAFKELQATFGAPDGDPATLGPKLQAAAADMRKYAPAEIQQAANTYADVMDAIGKAAAGGTFDQAALMKAIAEATSGNAKDIGATAVWVSKNCNL